MRLNTIVLALGILLTVSAFSQKISFFAEDLEFTLSDTCFEVRGWYFFRNNTQEEIRQMLFYPFPDQKTYGEIKFIEIHAKNDTTSLIANISLQGSLFRLQIPPNQKKAVWIRYRQECRSRRAKYIITSTQAWESPFENANYQLIFPFGFKNLTSSIPPDSIANEGDVIKYFWKREDFMPVEDFEFMFKSP